MVVCRGRWMTTLGACAALIVACARKAPGPSKEMKEALEQWGAGRTVSDGIERQMKGPDDTPRKRRGATALAEGESIWIQSGKSQIVRLPRPVKRVSIADPDLAGIVVYGTRTIQINARRLPKREPGAGGSAGGVNLTVNHSGIVTGQTLTPEPRIAETTVTIWDGSDTPDVHTLMIADFVREQVMLEVTVAEINRTAMEQHGIDFRQIGEAFVSAYFMGGGAGPKVPGLSTTVPSVATPLLPLTTTDTSPTYAFQLPHEDITAFIQLLQIDGLATILAQPKLLALSGQTAVFQVGGEIPIKIATSFVTDIEFKPFGTLVTFVPRVSDEGDILLTVTPEVSQPDFSKLVDGIPSFRTRRASTATRLRDGETLIIGGLLQNTREETVSGVPYLKDIPIAGYVFRSTNYTNDLTELMVVVTPHLVHPMPRGTQLPLPTDRGPLTNEEIRTRPDPSEATRPRLPGVP